MCKNDVLSWFNPLQNVYPHVEIQNFKKYKTCLFQILSEIMKQDSVTAEDLTTMLRPVVACLTRKTTMCSLISTPLTVSILNALNLLVANKNVAKVRETFSVKMFNDNFIPCLYLIVFK